MRDRECGPVPVSLEDLEEQREHPVCAAVRAAPMIGPHRDLGVGFGLVIPAGELSERVSRAGGPGGQRVNKVATRVSLAWNVAQSAVLSADQRARLLHKLGSRLTARGELVVHAQSEREQGRNRADARRRLASLVNAALTPERARTATRPGRGAVQRRLDTKRRRSQTKRARRPVGGDD